MTASIAPHRAALGTLLLLALAATASPAAAVTATILDSFTDPLPGNPMLPASGATVLFLGSLCDGAACPPGTIVTNPDASDVTTQWGLPGIRSPFRRASFATYFDPQPGSAGMVSIDPADGGRLAVESPGGPRLSVQLVYGNIDHPMNLDLRADGSNRFEIDIPELVVPAIGGLRVYVLVVGVAQYAGHIYSVPGPGTLVALYSDMPGLEDFDDEVAYVEVHFNLNQANGTGAFAVGEIRTALTPTPAEESSWGRIKSAYRR